MLSLNSIGELELLLQRFGVGTPEFEYVGKISFKTHPRRLYVKLRLFQHIVDFLNADFLRHFVWSVVQGKELGKVPAIESAGITLRSSLHTDFVSALQLVAMGFDVQARNILRSSREKLDLLWATSTNAELAADFIASQGLEASRDFFFRRLSKGKLREHAAAALAELTGEGLEAAQELWGEQRAEDDLMLAAAEHPNHCAGLMAMLPKLGQNRGDGFGLTGCPSNVSIRTLKIMGNYVIELLMLSVVSLGKDHDAAYCKIYGALEKDKSLSSYDSLAKLIVFCCIGYMLDRGEAP